MDLGEEEEWSVARTHAIRRNRRYATANSSENEFNVDALLKTTTGMTMEDLRQKMVNLKSARRRMALTASLDAVMSQFPLDDKVCRCLYFTGVGLPPRGELVFVTPWLMVGRSHDW